jgi:hypothetical protein
MPPHSYREFYGIQLLDDLHNFFPALLYAPENFVSVRDVLGYIRTRTSQEMNLFSMGQRDYNNTRVRTNTHIRINNRVQSNRQTTYERPTHATYTYTTRTTNRPSQTENENANFNFGDHSPNALRIPVTTAVDGSDQSVNMLASLFTLFAGDNVLDSLEPVVVRPTAAQLEANTEVYIAGENRCNCAVCLETPAIGAEIRKIRACGHSFHRRCIDIWFQRNVHCPVCRHDVRE